MLIILISSAFASSLKIAGVTQMVRSKTKGKELKYFGGTLVALFVA